MPQRQTEIEVALGKSWRHLCVPAGTFACTVPLPCSHLSSTTAVPEPWELPGAGNRNNCAGALNIPIFAPLSIQPGLSPPVPRSPIAEGSGAVMAAGREAAEHQECRSFPHSPCRVPRTWMGYQQPPAHPKAPPVQGKGKDVFGSFPSSFQKEIWDGLGTSVAGLGGNPRLNSST